MTNYITSKGVQQFTITIAASSATGTATISAVGSGAFIMFGGINPSVTNNPTADYAYLTLTNSTTITATRNSAVAGTIVVTGSIVDGDTSNLIKSVQYGTATIAAASTSGTASISAVTNTNTAIHYMGWISSNTTISAASEGTVVSLSGTTVTATRQASTGTNVTGYCIIEFQGSALNQSVQNVNASTSSSVTSFTSTISSVNANNTVMFFGGCNANATTNLSTWKQRASLTNATTVTVSVNAAAAIAKTYNCSVVEFISGVLNSSVQRGTTTLTSVATNTTSITNVVQANSGLSWLGNSATITSASAITSEANAQLTTAVPPITFVQAVGNQNTIGGNPLANTLSTGSIAGNCLIALAGQASATGSITGITDNKGQTWIQVPSAKSTNTTRSGFEDIWYFPNTVAGVTTVSVTYATSTSGVQISSEIYEVSGIVTTSPVQGAGVLNTGTAGTTVNGATITTTNAVEFIITSFSNGFSSVAAPYTAGVPSFELGAYRITTSAVTSDKGVFTQGSSLTYCSSIAAFLSKTAIQVVKSNRNNASANSTGSWEVFEFPAYVIPTVIGPYISDWFG